MNAVGRGKYKVWLRKSRVGGDLVYFVGGGERPHVGGITMCEPGKKPRNTKFAGHFDCVVTEPIAAAACKKHGRKVVCLGGVHVDDASKKEIRKLVVNCKRLTEFV